jgi:hypothetical protein
VKKTRLTENEGFGANTPDPSPFQGLERALSDKNFRDRALSAVSVRRRSGVEQFRAAVTVKATPNIKGSPD